MKKVLERIGPDKRNGFYVEAGANDGLKQSNTKYLEEALGWTGILVEPSLDSYKMLGVNRPNDICIHGCLVSSEYTDEFISGDFNGGLMSSVDGRRLTSTDLVRAPALTLAAIFAEHGIEKVDFVSLDTEGYELEILKGIDFEKVRPSYFLIEIYESMYGDIVDFLDSKGYASVGRREVLLALFGEGLDACAVSSSHRDGQLAFPGRRHLRSACTEGNLYPLHFACCHYGFCLLANLGEERRQYLLLADETLELRP